MSDPAIVHDGAGLNAAADEAIALCSGDARKAVKALLVASAFLKDELAMAANRQTARLFHISTG